MTYFVTGGAGLIGRHLVEELLRRREGDVHLLVRPGSEAKLAALRERWPHPERVRPVPGNLQRPGLGIDEAWVAEHRGRIAHVFHLAAIYDMTAPDEVNERLNVAGTGHAVDVANALEAGVLHHASSVAVAGRFQGLYREDMFDEGQRLPSAYHRTKFEAEKIVRERSRVPWRVYRPSLVIGHSRTGEMDKIDGPYYFFKLIQKTRNALPQWFPLVGPELGHTNLVPVDYVARAIDHIAHQPGLDGQAFHLIAPKSQRSGEVLNIFARAAHAPHMAMRVDKRLVDSLPKGVFSLLMNLPALREVRRSILADVGIPEEVLEHVGSTARFDSRDAERTLAGTGIEVPPLPSYAGRIWDYWERNLDPDLFKDRSFEAAVNGRTVVITGASSGNGRAAALKIARAGGVPLLVARGLEKLEATKAEIEAAGGTAYVYTADLSDPDSIDDLCARILADHVAVDMLVNNAGRSIRPSIGVQTSPPRFSAYVASKAALDAWTKVVSSEVVGDGITFSTIHMPLVRTPMIAPTKIYDSFPTISPDQAADLVCEALRAKPKQINTRLGTFGEVAYALAPKPVDQVLHMAYKVFPDSAASRGEKDPSEKASGEATALAYLMRGVHW